MTSDLTFKVEGREMTMERVFAAPPELVFRAYSEAEALAEWWGPKDWTLTHNDLDFRVGGRWHYCMTGPDGMESWGLANYKEIEAPKRLVYTDQFADAEGKALEGMPEMQITVDFIEQDGQTKVVSHTLFPSEEDLQKVVEMGVEQGFSETWDRLAEYLTE